MTNTQLCTSEGEGSSGRDREVDGVAITVRGCHCVQGCDSCGGLRDAACPWQVGDHWSCHTVLWKINLFCVLQNIVCNVAAQCKFIVGQLYI